MARILLTGESWHTNATHLKGFDSFVSATYHVGHRPFVAALENAGNEVTHLPAETAGTDFPLALDALAGYDVIILSDIGSNTLLLHPDTWLHGKRLPNRLKLIREFVANGGGFMMAGGYLSFQGIDGRARYHGTPIEEILPVIIRPYDDRVEAPEGLTPRATGAAHPVADELGGEWPPVLGLNAVEAKQGATVLVTAEDHPLLVVGEYGRGRVAAWTSDIGPHWCPEEFLGWSGFQTLWRNVIRWLSAGGEG